MVLLFIATILFHALTVNNVANGTHFGWISMFCLFIKVDLETFDQNHPKGTIVSNALLKYESLLKLMASLDYKNICETKVKWRTGGGYLQSE